MRVARTLLWTMLLLLLAWVGLALSGWLPPLTARQREDLALLRQAETAPESGTRAFASLLFAGFDLPAAEHPALLEQVVAARRAEPRWSRDQLQTLLNGRGTRLHDLGIDLPCAPQQPDCLMEVRGRLPEVSALLDLHSARLAQLQAGQTQAGPVWDPSFTGLESPQLIEWRHMRLPRVAAALGWARQPGLEPLAALCTHAAFWRRARAGTNSLLVDMVAAAEIGHSAQLLAAMLSEWPDSEPVPEACAAWAGTLSDAELAHCAIARHEFAGFDRTLSHLEQASRSIAGEDSTLGWIWRQTGNVFYQPEHTLARLATDHARACRAPLAQRAAAALPAPADQSCGLIENLFNPIGCVIIGVAAPDLSRVHQRRLDLDAQLRVLELALRWRAHPAMRPTSDGPVDGWAQGSQALHLDHAAWALKLSVLVPRESPEWTLPLPWPAAAVATPALPPTPDTPADHPPDAILDA